MSNWKTTRGDWLPLRTRDGAPARVGPGDSPTSHRGKQHHHQPGQFDSHTGTPRHQPLEAASIVLPPGQMPAAASSSSQPSGGGGGSIPFYNPMNSGSGNGNAGGLFDFLSGQQNESSEQQIHAPYFVSELLPPPQQQQQQQQNRGAETRNGSVASSSSSLHQQQQKSPSIGGLSSTSSVTESVDRNHTMSQQQQNNNNNNNNQHHQWVAFAPISPEEVQLAVSTIVGAFPAHTLSRYSIERTLTARFDLGPKCQDPTVFALYFYCGSRENALHVLHRHERGSLYKGLLGEVRCAVTVAPSFSLACGVLHPFSQANHLRNNNNNVENSISLQLAGQAGRGNVSVCRRLEIRQDVPLRFKVELLVKKYGKKVLCVLVAVFLYWLFFV